MNLQKAAQVAAGFRDELEPFCERIEIAGSVRRRKPLVKDIEMVAIPKLEIRRNLFGEEMERVNRMEEIFPEMRANGCVFSKNGERYKQIYSPLDELVLDLFIVLPPAQWGVIFTIRTGPADFSRKIVTQRSKGGLLPDDYWVANGCAANGDGVVPMPEETDFFRLLGIDFISPELRS